MYIDKALYLSENAPVEVQAFVKQREMSMGLIISRYEHCCERAAERYNLDLSYDDWEVLNFAIFRDDPKIVKYVDVGGNEGSSLYTVKFRGETMMVAYSDTAFLMITLMPRTDTRFRALQQGRYEVKGLTDTAMKYVEARQAVAETFDPATARPFEALASMPIQTVEPVKVEPIKVEPVITSKEAPQEPVKAVALVKEAEPVTAMFARLSATIEHRLNVPTDREAEIAALEARLVEMRRNVEADALSRRVLVGAQDLAAATYDQFRATLIGEDRARQTVAMLLASVEVTPIADPIEVAVPQTATPRRRGRGGSDYIKTLEAVKVRDNLKTPKQKRRAARDAEIIRFLAKGATQRAASAHFELSYSHICKIVSDHKAR